MSASLEKTCFYLVFLQRLETRALLRYKPDLQGLGGLGLPWWVSQKQCGPDEERMLSKEKTESQIYVPNNKAVSTDSRVP